MTGKERKNIIASVLARLRGTSKSSGAPFQQVLQLYAMERFLYRISKSKHAQSVILKGALLLKTIGIPSARPTMDIDMLRKGKADQATLRLGARPQADRVPLCGAYKGLEFSGSSFSVATIQQKFAHHVAAMHLRRCFGDVHLAGNLLVQPLYPCTRIARSRGVNSSIRALSALRAFFVLAARTVYSIQKILVPERLPQNSKAAAFIACTVIGMSPCPVMTTIGSLTLAAARSR